MRGKLRILLVIFLIVVPMASSVITINPQKYEIREIVFNKTYNIIITVINPDSRAYDIQVMANKDSYYLQDNINIEPVLFGIEPNQKENIQLSLSIPDTISPEEHILYLDFFSENHQLGIFKLSFTVPGEKIEKIEMDDVKLNKQPGEGLFYFEFRLENTGTVIARGSPIIEIYQDSKTIERFGEESRIIIMPNEDYNISLMYDTTHLITGDYEFGAKFMYNDIETNYSNGEFSVTEVKKTDKIENFDIYEGEKLTIKQIIMYPEEKLSFYSIEYIIAEKNIGDIVEGEMQGREKEINLEIDTSEFAIGTYDLEIVIKSGPRLEKNELRKIQITVKSKKMYYLQGIILFTIGILSIGILIYFIRSIAKKKPQINITDLNHEIINLAKDFKNIELTMRHFTQEINNFINDSNKWLESHGYGHYGFR